MGFRVQGSEFYGRVQGTQNSEGLLGLAQHFFHLLLELRERRLVRGGGGAAVDQIFFFFFFTLVQVLEGP